MAYPNEHSARIKDPGEFQPGSFRSKPLSPGVRVIIGKPRGGGNMEAQAYRFDKTKFTAAQAKTWLRTHKVKYQSFEAATAAKKSADALELINPPQLTQEEGMDGTPNALTGEEFSDTEQPPETTPTGVRRYPNTQTLGVLGRL